MSHKTTVKCGFCKKPFEARTADVNRGWGKFCSKSCKAKRQTKDTGISGPDYKASDRTVHQMQSGHYAKSKFKGRPKRKGGERWYRSSVEFDISDFEVEFGDAVYSHSHGCWLVRDNGDDPLIDAHPYDSEAAGFNNT